MTKKEAEDLRPNRIRELREGGVPLTQKEVAALMGIDHTTVSRHESGRGLTQEHIAAYTRLFKLDNGANGQGQGAGSVLLFMRPEELESDDPEHN